MVQGVQMLGVFVRDFEVAVRFYRDVLGIPLVIDAHGDDHHAEFSFQEPYFHFALFPRDGAPGDGPRVHVSFRVSNCRETFTRATAAGAVAVHGPRFIPYSGGGVSADVLDPDGNHIELFQPQQ